MLSESYKAALLSDLSDFSFTLIKDLVIGKIGEK
jgi:hypothetical protein